jgi:hypothetical protein
VLPNLFAVLLLSCAEVSQLLIVAGDVDSNYCTQVVQGRVLVAVEVFAVSACPGALATVFLAKRVLVLEEFSCCILGKRLGEKFVSCCCLVQYR